MKAANVVAAAENGASIPRENLQHFLNVLNESVDDPASTVDEVLAASSGEEIKD